MPRGQRAVEEAPREQCEDLYAVLGVPRDATPTAIKHAYRRLALQLHPDKAGQQGGAGGAPAAFQRVSFAYSVLSNAEKRRYYDATGDTEELEVSAEEFASSLHEMLDELLGGLTLQELVGGLSRAEARRMPPFPFPERLFPPGTFPPGMRFSDEMTLPPAVEAVLASGGPQALQALAKVSAPGSARRGPSAMVSGSESESSGWHTDESQEAEEERNGGAAAGPPPSQPAAPSPAAAGPSGGDAKRRWLEAAKAGHLSALQALHGQDPSLWSARGTGLGHTALHWAAAQDDVAMVAWLLSVAPQDGVHVRNAVGGTAVHAAAGNDAVRALAELLRSGADPTLADESGESPRDVASRLKRPAALAALEAVGRNPAATAQAASAPVAATRAASAGAPAEQPPKRSPLPAMPPAAPTHLSPSAEDAADGPPHVEGVERAAGRAWLEAARAGDTAAMAAALAAEPRLLYWWGSGTSLGFTGHSALHWAAARGHVDVLRLLLAAGMMPDVPNHGGGRALHAAAGNGQAEAARVLVLEGGADPALRDGLGETATQRGLAAGHTAAAAAIDTAGKLVLARRLLTDGENETTEGRSTLLKASRAALAAAGMAAASAPERSEVLAAAAALVAASPQLLCQPGKRVPAPSPCTAERLPTNTAITLAPAPASDDAPDASKLAAEARLRGNAAFSSGAFPQAVRAYSIALRLDPNSDAKAALLSNRSAAHAAAGNFEAALEDADRCIKAAPQWGKAHGRRGAALVGLGQAGEAVKAYLKGLAVEPDAVGLRDGLDAAKAAIREAQGRYTAMWGETAQGEGTS